MIVRSRLDIIDLLDDKTGWEKWGWGRGGFDKTKTVIHEVACVI